MKTIARPKAPGLVNCDSLAERRSLPPNVGLYDRLLEIRNPAAVPHRDRQSPTRSKLGGILCGPANRRASCVLPISASCNALDATVPGCHFHKPIAALGVDRAAGEFSRLFQSTQRGLPVRFDIQHRIFFARSTRRPIHCAFHLVGAILEHGQPVSANFRTQVVEFF